MQQLDKTLFDEFEDICSAAEHSCSSKITNSGRKPKGRWTQMVVDKVRISELASDRCIDKCPNCNYGLYFDDSTGGFICATQRWNGEKCFAGGIVQFTEWLMKEGKW